MSVGPLLSAAKHLINKGQIAEARRLLHQAVSLEPNSADAWLMLAAVSAPQASLEYAQKALSLCPDKLAAREALAWAQRRVTEFEKINLELPASPIVIRQPGVYRPRLPARAAEPPSPVRVEPVAATPVYAPVREQPQPPYAPLHWRQFNWPLIIGSLLVSAVLFIAVFGPRLAPRDPMEEMHVAQVGETWLAAPYPPFTVPGFPLGSDKLGRDVFSQLLWAVRPTMILVSIVAGVRLALGIIIGLASGWSA
ncbi:MAG TPA: tetratricopeptide repeat protein, partial [Anaerolineales bacterium]|nr:tetratricopeptide repeat protein [Anaerolineales bacterium]